MQCMCSDGRISIMHSTTWVYWHWDTHRATCSHTMHAQAYSKLEIMKIIKKFIGSYCIWERQSLSGTVFTGLACLEQDRIHWTDYSHSPCCATQTMSTITRCAPVVHILQTWNHQLGIWEHWSQVHLLSTPAILQHYSHSGTGKMTFIACIIIPASVSSISTLSVHIPCTCLGAPKLKSFLSNFGKGVQLVRVPWKCVCLVWLLSWQPDCLGALFLPRVLTSAWFGVLLLNFIKRWDSYTLL